MNSRNMILSNFVFFLSLALLFNASLAYSNSCPETDKKTAITMHAAAETKEWSTFESLAENLKMEHLIPQETIQKAKAAGVQLELQTLINTPKNHPTRETGLIIHVKAGNSHVLHAEIYPRSDRKGSVEVHNLEMRNEIDATSNKPLSAGQERPGLGMNAFKHGVIGLVEIINKGPYKSIISEMPQHYGVFKLYERVAEFKPIDQRSKEFFDMLDQYRKEARSWTNEYKVKNTDQFVEILGAHGISNASQSLFYAWEGYKQSGQLAEGMQLIFNSKNVPIAIAKKSGSSTSDINFIDNSSSNRDLIDWSQNSYQLIRIIKE